MKNTGGIQRIRAVTHEPEHDDFMIDGSSYKDCHSTCIIHQHITYYGIGTLTDDQEEAFLHGDYTHARIVGKITGWLILCGQMLCEGEEPCIVCDDENADVGYIISALSDPGEVLDENPFSNVFYIDQIDCEDELLLSAIIDRLPATVLGMMHVHPDVVAFFPTPKPYDQDEGERERTQALQRIASQKMSKMFPPSEENANSAKVLQFGVNYQLTETEVDVILGRRVKGDEGYPEEAKNEAEFSFFKKRGFTECGNSRVLYRIINDV